MFFTQSNISMTVSYSNRHIAWGVLFIFITALLFWSGLSGTFLLDDFPNLSILEAIKASPTLPQIFITLGSFFERSGIQSRILTFLTFIPQYSSWPIDPWSFKLVNLLIHLCNAVLVYCVVLKATRLSNLKITNKVSFAMLVAFLWAIHPIQSSTIFYVVQRMTELMTFFTLLGLLSYLSGREKLKEQNDLKTILLMSVAVGFFMLMGMLCKENAVLLLLYILVIEFTLLSNLEINKNLKIWLITFVIFPIIIILSYFLINQDHYFITGYSQRNFTLYERLITEPYVLFLYLSKIIFPSPSAFGLYYDDIAAFKSIFSSYKSLVSVLGLVFLTIVAFLKRRRWKVFSFAVLFYISGQILESSVFPLELMFEHRNYLPMLGITFALVYFGYISNKFIQNAYLLKFVQIVFFLYILLIGFTTYDVSKGWGDYVLQAHYWVQQRPESVRARENLANVSLGIGDYKQAGQVYSLQHQQNPNSNLRLLMFLKMDCFVAKNNNVQLPDEAHVMSSLRAGHFDVSDLGVVDQLINLSSEGRCQTINDTYLLNMLDNLSENKEYKPSSQAEIYFLRARIFYLKGYIDHAIKLLDNAMKLKKHPGLALQAVEWLSGYGRYSEAIQYLHLAKKMSTKRLSSLLYSYSFPEWEKQLRSMQEKQSN